MVIIKIVLTVVIGLIWMLFSAFQIVNLVADWKAGDEAGVTDSIGFIIFATIVATMILTPVWLV